jgi:HK97 family phage portal protein
MIVRTRGGDVELRSELGTLLSQYGLGRVGYGPTAGVPVTTMTVAGIPAVGKAVSFAAQSVAMLTPAVWSGNGPLAQRVDSTWQARFFRAVPNDQQTWFEFFEALQASLDYRGNCYIWKSKDAAGKLVAAYALHPDQIYMNRESTTREILFRVAFGEAYPTPPEVGMHASVRVDRSVVRHIRGRGGTGELVAPSPITQYRTALGVGLAKLQHEANLYENGVQGGAVLSYPGGTTREQAERWRELFDSQNAGVSNTGKTRVTGGGATLTPVGMSQVDAQFVESVGLSILDASNIFDVPPWFLGVNEKAAKTQLPEHEETRWVNHGLNTRLRRLEAAINADPDFFGPGSATRFAFDTSELIHPDAATSAEISLKKVQSGQWLVDESRAKDGLEPLKDGLGQIPQIIPVGGSPAGVPVPKASEE